MKMPQEVIVKVSQMIGFNQYWVETNKYLHRLSDRCDVSNRVNADFLIMLMLYITRFQSY